uniref:Uncharacterized protein n=1 Tax=Arundo donax TaxID=35708 RepID=A0A0A9GQY8_ARUDO
MGWVGTFLSLDSVDLFAASVLGFACCGFGSVMFLCSLLV